MNDFEKILKYIIWAGLGTICFIPLIIGQSFYYPFIVPKTLAFRIIIEIIFMAFLALCIINKEYRPKLNLVIIIFFLYLLSVVLSSLLAGTFYDSFWSNNERSEGLLLLLHLFAFLIIASGFLKKLKDWLIVFEASFFSSILVSFYALAQFFKFDFVIKTSSGERLASTIGNAGYVAGYLVFNILFGLLLLFCRKNKYLRWYYILGIMLQIFVVFQTYTRGGIIALMFVLAVFILYLGFYYFKTNKTVRYSSLAILILIVLLTGLIFINKNASWVENFPIFNRIASISLNSSTAQSRLMTWNSAWQGFKEKPIIGYGYENFYQPFDKYFNPQIYKRSGSIVWFDRAHNIIFDRLITGGLIGLVLYLGFLLLPIYFIWKYYRKTEQKGKYLIPVLFSLIIVGYIIQNFFIFEALVTYIPLFLVLAFLSLFTPSWGNKFSQSKQPYLVLITIFIIAFLPVVFSVNVKPIEANLELVKAINMSTTSEYQTAYYKFIKIIDMNTFGNQEYRQHMAEFIFGSLSNSKVDDNWKAQAALKMEQVFDKQIEEKPQSVKNYLMVMRFLDQSYSYNIERLNKSLELFEKAKVLSPTRPMIYHEAGYAQVYLGIYWLNQKDQQKADEFFDKAFESMQKAIDLNPQVIDSYANMIMILFVSGRSEQIDNYINTMEELKLDYLQKQFLEKMSNSAIYAAKTYKKESDYKWTLKFYQQLSQIDPQNPNYLINQALAYASLGQKEKAVEAALKIKEFGGDYAAQADLFIKDIEAGKYDPPKTK